MTGKRTFWLAVLLQVLVLLGMAGIHQYTLATGTPVTLQVVPLDPWDPLRGSYVRLSYSITQLGADQVSMTGQPYQRGQVVWVTLRKGSPGWTATAVSTSRPSVGVDELALKGRVDWGYEDPTGYRARISYGVEQFYVPEGEGPTLEQAREKMTVEVAVDRFGRAALRSVFVDGKPIHWK